MQSVIKFIEKYFWAIILIACALGILIPKYFIPLKPSLTYILAFVLLLSFLKIDTEELFTHFKKPKLIIWLSFTHLILVPVVLFFAVKYFDLNLAIAILLTAAAPAAVAAPAMTDLFKGNVSLSLVITVITHIFIPITLPLLLFILVGQKISLPIFDIFTFIATVVILPFILSVIIKKIFPKSINKIQPYFKTLTIMAISVIIATAIALNINYLQENPVRAILYLFVFLFLGLLFHFIGNLLAYKKQKSYRISSAVTLAYNNQALILLIAMQFFSPEILFYIVCYEITWNLMPVFSKFIFSKLKD